MGWEDVKAKDPFGAEAKGSFERGAGAARGIEDF